MPYRKIDTKIWSDPKVRALSPHAKLLFVYAITSPHGHLSGIYYLPQTFVIYETGLSKKEVETARAELIKRGLVRYDRDKEVVMVENMLRYQARGPKNMKSVATQLGALHDTVLIPYYLKKYDDMNIPYSIPYSIPNPEKDDKDQEQDQEKDQEQEKEKDTPSSLSKKSQLQMLLDEGVKEQTARDFLTTRKVKLTQTALDGLKREAKKACLTMQGVAAICAEHGWRGFKADWDWPGKTTGGHYMNPKSEALIRRAEAAAIRSKERDEP